LQDMETYTCDEDSASSSIDNFNTVNNQQTDSPPMNMTCALPCIGGMAQRQRV
jgi:hypothetical protein